MHFIYSESFLVTVVNQPKQAYFCSERAIGTSPFVMKPESKWQKIGAFLAAAWGIGSFLFILIGFIVALAYLILVKQG